MRDWKSILCLSCRPNVFVQTTGEALGFNCIDIVSQALKDWNQSLRKILIQLDL